MQHNLSILVENHSGVLLRVANLFSRRGFNIESIAAGPTHDAGITRITVCVDCDNEQIQQLVKQLHKIPVVLRIKNLMPDTHFSRELVFIKVTCDEVTRTSIIQVVNVFRGHVVDVSKSTITIEISGQNDKIQALLEILRPYGIVELVRTGRIAIERGKEILSLADPENT